MVARRLLRLAFGYNKLEQQFLCLLKQELEISAIFFEYLDLSLISIVNLL